MPIECPLALELVLQRKPKYDDILNILRMFRIQPICWYYIIRDINQHLVEHLDIPPLRMLVPDNLERLIRHLCEKTVVH